MDPTLIIAGIGMVTSFFGANKANKAARKAARTQAEIAKTQNEANDIQTRASVEISKATKQQEEIRKQTVVLEATRARRELIRNTRIANATAVSRAANQGALTSSGLAGTQSSINAASNEQAGLQQTNIDNALTNFALNNNILNIQEETAVQLSEKNKKLANLGTTLSNAQGQQDFGKSLFNTGISIAQNASTIASTGSSLFNGKG